MKTKDISEIEKSEVIFTNSDGTEYCKRTIEDVTFIFEYLKKDTYSIKIGYDGKVSNNQINGKIFIDNGKRVRKNLEEHLVHYTKISSYNSEKIIEQLWDELSHGLGDWIFFTSEIKRNADAQYFREAESLKINVDDITNEILVDNSFITFDDNKVTFFYENGMFKQGGDDEIEIVVRKMLTNYATIARVNEITRNIKSKTSVDRHSLDKDLNLININNGMYNISTGELLEHSPKYKSIRQLPFNYNPDAKCPNIEKFMSEILPEDDIETIYELIGYAMIPKTNIRNATCILVGDGANGKSVLLNLVRDFIGKDNISVESLQTLETDKFATASLYGKLLNIFSDLSSKQIYDNNIFKQLTGSDGQIRGERKYTDSFSFENIARLMFAANKLPPVPEDEMYAFFSRMMVFTFENKFEGTKDDKNLLFKITTNEELSGLFNIVIEKLRNIIETDKFTYKKSIGEIETVYRKHSDDALVFMGEKIEESDGQAIPKKLMYDIYTKWCKENSIAPQSTNKFTRRITALGYILVQKGSRGKQIQSWNNCKFRGTESIGTISDEKHPSVGLSIDMKGE